MSEEKFNKIEEQLAHIGNRLNGIAANCEAWGMPAETIRHFEKSLREAIQQLDLVHLHAGITLQKFAETTRNTVARLEDAKRQLGAAERELNKTRRSAIYARSRKRK